MTYTDLVLADTPLVYYRMGETGSTETDQSSNGRNGTMSGNYLRSRPSLLPLETDNNSTDFGNPNQGSSKGSSGFCTVSCPYDSGLVTSSWSYEFWTNKGSSAPTACLQWTGRLRLVIGDSYQVHQYTDATNFSLVASSSTGFLGSADYTIAKHVVVTYDGAADTVLFYRNGVLVTTVTGVATALRAATDPIFMGFNDGNDGLADADEFAFYGYVLPAARVTAHYSGVAPEPDPGDDSGNDVVIPAVGTPLAPGTPPVPLTTGQRKPPSQRDPAYTALRHGRTIQSMSPGTAHGRVANASPVELNPSAISTLTLDPSSPTTEVKWAFDTRVLTASNLVALSYVPQEKSARVFLNGWEQRENVDYTISNGTVAILAAMDTQAGDRLDVRYVRGAPAQSTPLTARGATANYASSAPTLHGSTVAGDLVIVAVGLDVVVGTAVTYNGYADHGYLDVTHDTNSLPNLTYRLRILSKVVTGSGDVPTWTSTYQPVWGAVTYAGAGIVLDVDWGSVSDGTSATPPAAAVGSSWLRTWMALSNLGSMAVPARGASVQAVTGGTDIDLGVQYDNDATNVTATETVSAGWAMATVSLTGT